MPSIFFTGFPGFLGVELLPRVLRRAADHDAVCLVQPKFASLARLRAEQLESAHPGLAGRIRIVEGDITHPALGLDNDAHTGEVTEIYHLAAVYDLSVARELAMRVNVDGTRHLLDFAGRCRSLQRFHYISTCYVSGRYAGVFKESDLQKGQRFNNFYEETKYLAEVEVQRRMAEGLPATVYRPAVVVGDSHTGATQKYDGPYYVIQWLLRQPRVAVMPVVGNPHEHCLNVVPRDFVVEAIAYLSGRPEAAGKVYQLADPNPLNVDEMLEVLARATRKTLMRIPLPRGFAKAAIERLPGVYATLRIPASAIDYFVHPTRYDTTQLQRDLRRSGLEIPRFDEYAHRLVEFARQHPEIGAAGMA
jgi:thioester reductase-like protein